MSGWKATVFLLTTVLATAGGLLLVNHFFPPSDAGDARAENATIAITPAPAWATGVVTEPDKLERFHDEIDAALAVEGEAARIAAVENLFHLDGLDDWERALAMHLAAQVSALAGQHVTFDPLEADDPLVQVSEGYEYRPNLNVLGRVVFTDAQGQTTDLFFGQPTGQPEAAYRFAATERTLVAPDAPPDKGLEILVVGLNGETPQFAGWCDVALSNGKTRRVPLTDEGAGNVSYYLEGQAIEVCDLDKLSDEGLLSLRLLADGAQIFKQRLEGGAGRITYAAPE
jgi:hypothetical protein